MSDSKPSRNIRSSSSTRRTWCTLAILAILFIASGSAGASDPIVVEPEDATAQQQEQDRQEPAPNLTDPATVAAVVQRPAATHSLRGTNDDAAATVSKRKRISGGQRSSTASLGAAERAGWVRTTASSRTVRHPASATTLVRERTEPGCGVAKVVLHGTVVVTPKPCPPNDDNSNSGGGSRKGRPRTKRGRVPAPATAEKP